jgi:hypothetical protein
VCLHRFDPFQAEVAHGISLPNAETFDDGD